MVIRSGAAAGSEGSKARIAGRGEQTRKEILRAAARQFAAGGYESVTIRHIAEEAGCSHTAIYLYFADKESLLRELATPPLGRLKARFERLLKDPDIDPSDRIKVMSEEYLRFGLKNRALYRVFVATESIRVDQLLPEAPLNRLRLEIFGLLAAALRAALGLAVEDERSLGYSRVFFFMLHGIVATYDQSKESVASIIERLASTFAKAVEVCLAGFREDIARRRDIP